ncbi:MAG: magnesium transporter CorA family protein [Actinomycetota bacterium]
MLTALCHSEERGWSEVKDLSTVSDLRADEASLVWGEADMTDLAPGDFSIIVEEFELDPLAVEDALSPRQRPKLESYEKHRFAVLHELYELDDQLEKRQISAFVGEDFLLVIHEGAEELLARVRDRVSRSGHDRRGPIYLLYALLDAVVDGYQELADNLEEQIERIEEAVVERVRDRVRRTSVSRTDRAGDEQVQLQLYSVKQQVARLRRYALPLQRVLDWLLDNRQEQRPPKWSQRLFRDVHDHTVRIAEQVHNVDELAQAVIDLMRSEQSEELSQINKKLTAWAAIIAVPTVIAGIYGMNYELFPSRDQVGMAGFWISLGIMAVAALMLYNLFKRKDWL